MAHFDVSNLKNDEVILTTRTLSVELVEKLCSDHNLSIGDIGIWLEGDAPEPENDPEPEDDDVRGYPE